MTELFDYLEFFVSEYIWVFQMKAYIMESNSRQSMKRGWGRILSISIFNLRTSSLRQILLFLLQKKVYTQSDNKFVIRIQLGIFWYSGSRFLLSCCLITKRCVCRLPSMSRATEKLCISYFHLNSVNRIKAGKWFVKNDVNAGWAV